MEDLSIGKGRTITNHNTTTSKQRIEYIDLAKGICICLVILTHSHVNCDDHFKLLIHLRMPLYFFLSGLFYKDYGGLLKTTLRKIDKLIIPFLFFTLVWLIFYLAIKIASNSPIDINHIVTPNGRIVIEGLWFLPCLFFQSIIFCLICRNFKTSISKTLIVTLIAFIGICLSLAKITIPVHLDCAMTCMPFYFMGYIAKRTPILHPNKLDKYFIPIAICLIITAIGLSIMNDNGSLTHHVNEFNGSMLLNYLQSASLIIAFMMIIKQVKHLPLISYVGKYSIILLGLHHIIITINELAYDQLGFEYNGFITSIITVVVCAVCIKPLVNYIPFFTAQKNLLSKKF